MQMQRSRSILKRRRSISSTTSTSTVSSSESASSIGDKRVSFDGKATQVFLADDWDRTPATVTFKLTWKDVAELKELDVAIVGKAKEPLPAMSRTTSRKPSPRSRTPTSPSPSKPIAITSPLPAPGGVASPPPSKATILSMPMPSPRLLDFRTHLQRQPQPQADIIQANTQVLSPSASQKEDIDYFATSARLAFPAIIAAPAELSGAVVTPPTPVPNQTPTQTLTTAPGIPNTPQTPTPSAMAIGSISISPSKWRRRASTSTSTSGSAPSVSLVTDDIGTSSVDVGDGHNATSMSCTLLSPDSPSRRALNGLLSWTSRSSSRSPTRLGIGSAGGSPPKATQVGISV